MAGIFLLNTAAVFAQGNWQNAVTHPMPTDNVSPNADPNAYPEDLDANEILMLQSALEDDKSKLEQAALPITIPDFPGEGSSTYTLGKTDVIEISVLRHPEVSGQYMINNEGKIQYEFVGDVVIEGMVKDQVKDKIAELLGTYIVAPDVTVKIVGYNSKVVYVVGEVGAPGKIFMRGDTITVREALVQAGLPLLTASTRKGKLITPSSDGNPKKLKVDVYALLYEGDLRENMVMVPGDTLYVPATGLTKVMRAIQPVASPIGTAAGTGRTVTTGF